MVKSFEMPYFYFPSTVLFLDDNKNFLSGLSLKIDNKTIMTQLSEPLHALKLIKSQNHIQTTILDSFNAGAHEPDNLSELKLDFSQLYKIIYNEERFNEITVLVIDYEMPTMNGIELCRILQEDPVKKIMLTGVADADLAIKAFNEGIVDKFLLKCSPTLFEDLNTMIADLQYEYFQQIGKFFIPNSQFPHNRIFKKLINEIFAEKHISEYYLLDSNGTLLLLDYHGKPSVLEIKARDQLKIDETGNHGDFHQVPDDKNYIYKINNTDKYLEQEILSHEKHLILPGKFLLSNDEHNLPVLQQNKQKKMNRLKNDIQFTPRELECILLLMQGYTSKMIAARLGLSPRTIESYMVNIKRKTGCFTKSSLIKYFQQQRLFN